MANRPSEGRGAGRRESVQRFVLAATGIVVALVWVNSRMFLMRRNSEGARPVVYSGYYVYHGMALALREGRLGQIDMAAHGRYLALNDPLATYERLPAGKPHDWRHFYSLDIGYLFIVEAARLGFPSLPDNILRALALQLAADAVLVVAVYLLFAPWSRSLGALAALLYVGNVVFVHLVVIAYYYYWDVPLTFLVLAALLAAYRRREQPVLALALAAAGLGFGVWLRGTWWPLALFAFGLAATVSELRRALIVPLVVFAVIAAPQIVRSSVARGHFALSTRTVWHVALVGLGYSANPYGLSANDESVFTLTKEKYGVPFRSEDYEAHDQAAKREFLGILTGSPRFVAGSFLRRLGDSLLGATPTSVRSYPYVPNGLYRIACVIGLALMLARGGDARFLAIAAAGLYAIYVVLTSVFYFVGLDYDNVSQVAMFVSIVGGIDTAVRWTIVRGTAGIQLGHS